MSSIISVRVNEAEAEILKNASEVYGCAVSSLLKKLAIEKIEDDFDIAIVREYEAHKKAGTLETRPIKEFFDELGL